ncbi:MAG: 3-isopropylmalate dehydratase small subunit [Deltaproteobacteria bacterium]|nr:3-isopropylmalate dehydratase small subunit [Deltaproteobacteria bacterium]
MSDIRKITKVTGTGIPVRGNDIDTDRIIPARYLKEVTFSRMGDFPFFDERFDADGKPKPHSFNDPKYKGASILFVNKNFGCGSSREHAPQAIMRFGVQAIVGESFAAIFAGNCVMIGIPAVIVSAADAEALLKLVESSPNTSFTVDLNTKTISFEGGEVRFDLPESHHNALTTGAWDSTAVLRANLAQVKEVASKLPYVDGFKS